MAPSLRERKLMVRSAPPTATTVLDSILFRDAFGTPRMREVFSDLALISRYVEVEVALAKAEARCGVIPRGAAKEIAARVECRGARLRSSPSRNRHRRLSDPPARASARETMRRGRPLRALGRDDPGHHGHGRCPAGPRRTAHHRGRHRRPARHSGRPIAAPPRHAHGRPHPSAAGAADHLRL